MIPHLSVVTYDHARIAEHLVRNVFAADGVIDEDEAAALTACQHTTSAANANRTAEALAHAIVRPTVTTWYLTELIEARQVAIDELAATG
jgi:hypothetical protein